MPAAALIIGGAGIGSALIGADAADRASDRQTNAGINALAQQREMFNKTQANFQPYLDVGKGATYTLGSLYGIGPDGSTGNTQDFSAFNNSPDFAFAQQQGALGLDRYENAKGLALSGGALKDVAQFNQGLATQQFGNYFQRLMSLSQLGQNAASGAASSAGNFSGQIANTTQGIGQSQASGIVGGANAITGGINGSINNSLLYNAINRSSYAPANPGTTPLPAGGGEGGSWLI
jgi:hypothetical protein